MRKLDDIIPPSRRKDFDMGSAPERGIPQAPPPGPVVKTVFPYRTALVSLIIVGAVVGALMYFSSAKVVITPNSVSATVSGSFTALAGESELPFEVVSAQKVVSQSVPGSGSKTVNQSASGVVTVYNTQAKAQTLVTNTRFAAKNGLIFRIHKGVTVPAGTQSNPGSIQVTVYADQAGDSYNIGPSSFTLPGLSGTPQFTQVTAISTASMTGGASGTVPIAEKSAEESARTALMTALQADLANSLSASVPDGYVLLSGSATTTFTALSSSPSQTAGMVDVKEQGTISAAVFPARALATAIATESLGGSYGNEAMTFATIDQLRLTSSVIPTADLKTYPFTLSGVTTLVYVVDPSRITSAIAGKTRELAKVALTSYPEIKKAVLILRPFWRQSFPEDPASISVVVEKP